MRVIPASIKSYIGVKHEQDPHDFQYRPSRETMSERYQERDQVSSEFNNKNQKYTSLSYRRMESIRAMQGSLY
jgi:hypothetical protein